MLAILPIFSPRFGNIKSWYCLTMILRYGAPSCWNHIIYYNKWPMICFPFITDQTSTFWGCCMFISYPLRVFCSRVAERKHDHLVTSIKLHSPENKTFSWVGIIFSDAFDLFSISVSTSWCICLLIWLSCLRSPVRSCLSCEDLSWSIPRL